MEQRGTSVSAGDLWRIIRNQFWIIILTVALGLGLSLVYGFLKPAQYKTDFVVQVGIVGDTWLHSPVLTEQQCRSEWFLNGVGAALADKYSGRQLKTMVEPELLLTPTKGLTRHVKVTVKAPTAGECYAIAAKVGELLVGADRDAYERTSVIYESYLADLRKVAAALAAGGSATGGAELGVIPIPPNTQDDSEKYAGGARAVPLFERGTNYEENPFLIPSVALLEQVYITTYVKARSPVFSQPTVVSLPPVKPPFPEGPGRARNIIVGTLSAFFLGITLAAVNYRLSLNRTRR